MNHMIDDNRFVLIEKYKQRLVEGTNIESRPEEMAVLDSILFRFWQMGWLDKLEQSEPHWIPVTERLPESKEEDLEYPTVLITFENEEIMLGCFYESTKEWGTGEYFDKKCDPIAWMPLPGAFKGVTE